jgi:DNA-binding transcriptional ArsR family regulator
MHGSLPPEEFERAAEILKAMGDPSRLRILDLLVHGELCVTEIVAALGEKFSTVSQRLKLLRDAGLILRRRSGNHIHYALADRHVVDLLHNALAHAAEMKTALGRGSRSRTMATSHQDHAHKHAPGCGHKGIEHAGHVDYLHDGHLHHMTVSGGVEEHHLDVTAENPAECTPKHVCGAHDKTHKHAPACGHEAVPHGDHVDYLVDGHLHHPHGDHCDDHGKVRTA